MDLGEQDVGSKRLQMAQDDPTLEDAVEAVVGCAVGDYEPAVHGQPRENGGEVLGGDQEALERDGSMGWRARWFGTIPNWMDS